MVAVYLALPLDDETAKFRRATIAERYFKPAQRMELFQEQAASAKDNAAIQKVRKAGWNIADARAYAPNDWPYLETREFVPSPSVIMRKALAFAKQGKTTEAEQALAQGKQTHSYAQCEFAMNLAVIYYATGKKEAALSELEGVQEMASPAARPECQRAQFLLGSLYTELGRSADAKSAFQNFLANTEKNTDKQTLAERQQAKNLLAK